MGIAVRNFSESFNAIPNCFWWEVKLRSTVRNVLYFPDNDHYGFPHFLIELVLYFCFIRYRTRTNSEAKIYPL